VGRAQDAATAVDPLGQHLASPRVILHVDEHAPEVRHRPQGENVLWTEDAPLRVEELLKGGPSGGDVAEGAMRQSQVVEDAEG